MTKRRCTLWMSVFLTVLLIGFECLFVFGRQAAQSAAAPPATTLKVGDAAPDFELPDQNSKKVRLSDFRGKKNVVLAFYVLAFTGG